MPRALERFRFYAIYLLLNPLFYDYLRHEAVFGLPPSPVLQPILPFIITSMRNLQMLKPNPLPPCSLAVLASAQLNGWKGLATIVVECRFRYLGPICFLYGNKNQYTPACES